MHIAFQTYDLHDENRYYLNFKKTHYVGVNIKNKLKSNQNFKRGRSYDSF